MAADTTTQFVLDAIEALAAIGAQEAVAFLLMMLDCNGPDVDGVVTSLIDFGIVSPDGVESTTMHRDFMTKNSLSFAKASRSSKSQ